MPLGKQVVPVASERPSDVTERLGGRGVVLRGGHTCHAGKPRTQNRQEGGHKGAGDL